MKGKKTSPAVLNAMKKYYSGAKGTDTRKKYVARRKEIISEYNRKYQSELRGKMKRIGFCTTCKKRPGKIKKYLDDKGIWREKSLTICEICSEMNKQRAKRWRLKNETN